MPFEQSGAIYLAMVVALVVWLGIFALLWRLDRQARELRRRLDEAPRSEQPAAPRVTVEARAPRAEPASRDT